MKKIFLLAVAAALSFSCSKDPNNGLALNQDVAYLALAFPTEPMGRANTSDPGTAVESKMGTATVLLFNDALQCLGSTEFAKFTTPGDLDSKEVPAKTTKIFVVVNNYTTGWGLATAAVSGKSWEAINTYAAVTGANLATNDAFVMANSGDKDKGGLIDVTLYETADAAKNAPALVAVDRLASKVTVTTATPVVATNGKFAFQGWALNTVNQTSRLYAERVPYANATAADVAGVYRRDKNYFKADFPIASADLTTYIKANYVWLSNAPLSDVNKTTSDVLYCPENTMDADAQLWGHTTKVVVKGKYAPERDAKGTVLTTDDSYFWWNGNYYSTANLKVEYKLPTQIGLKTDLIKFLAAADATFGALTPTEQEENTNIDAAIDNLNATSGIVGRYKAVRYFHESVSYYDALIRHDSGVTTNMALGRYGVVRNNTYNITITEVKGPGTPWIPDPTDPEDPSKPTDPDDEVDVNLSIQVTVLPWTVWAQDVVLG